MKKLCDTGMWIPDTDIHFEYLNTKSDVLLYQHDRIDIAIKYCKQFKLALDIGAHIGLISKKLIEHFTNVWAFEAEFKNYHCLVKNVSKDIVAFNLAVGSEEKYISTKFDPINTGNTYITEGNDTKQITIDSLETYDLGFIKIDTQGYELEVLQGAVETINRFKPVILLEEEKTNIYTEPENACKFLEAMNYTCVKKIKRDRIMVPK